jgi:hypothetical protein
MMKNFSEKQKALFYVCVWFVLNFIVSVFTPLADDEAYYWVYAKYLDWGYFDHPPMIAVMIKAGGFLFQNEISIRFFTVVASSLTLWILFQLTDFKRTAQLFLLFLTVPAFHALGFISAPDVPMLLFGTWYMYRFKKYLEEDSTKNILALSLVIAALMFSKYHGLLLVIFTLIPNYKLLARKSFYIVFFLSLLFFFPHIWWQIQNDFVSVRFHLFDRVRGHYELRYTIDYILGQLVFCGPVLMFLFFAKIRSQSFPFAKTLKWAALGFILFFFLNSFRTFVEANWVAMGYVAALLLVHASLKERLHRVVKYSSLVIISVLFLFRLFLISPIDKRIFEVTEQFGRGREYYEEIHKRAGDRVVVFPNNYQKASKYFFYFNQPSFTLNAYWYRRNQYDKWPMQKEAQGKPAMTVGLGRFEGCTTEYFNNDSVFYEFVPSLKTYGYLTFELEDKKYEVTKGTTLQSEFKVINPFVNEIKYDSIPCDIFAVLINDRGDYESPIWVKKCLETDFNSSKSIPFELLVNVEKGEYKMLLGVYCKSANVLLNSQYYQLFVK